jgi:hypothetical protein
MDRTAILAIGVVAVYIVWLLAFVFVVEAWLRQLTGWMLGITIERQLHRTVGKPELLDILFVFSWHIAEPAGLGMRFLVGFLRVMFWSFALILPIAAAIGIYLLSKS